MTSDMHEEDVAGSASFGRHDPGEAVATPAARPAQAVPADSEAPRIAGNVLHRSMLPLPSARDHVVAIIAPSGYGKTTLAVQWFHESMAHGTASWMQIDERCRDPAVFLRRLNEAMNIAWHGLPGNFQGAEDHDSAMTALLSEMHRRSKRQLLFVDDVHLLAGSTAMLRFHQLLLGGPRNLALILTSRDADGIGLASLAQRGEVRWITSTQLLLSREEIAALATHNGIDLAQPELDAIADTTEGWPALAQLALYGLHQRGAAQRMSVDLAGLPVASYIHDRFLAGLGDEERSLISILAMLSEVTPGLVASLCSATGMKALTRFEHMGLIRRQGRAGGEACFIIHPLIRDEIRRRDDDGTEHRRQLQARAAAWWWSHEDPDRAIRLALAAGMKDELRTWLRTYAPVLVDREGRHETFLDLMSASERLWEQRDPELASWAVSSLMFLRRYPEAERMLDESAPARNGDGRQDPADLQRAVIAGLRDDYVTAGRFARSWIARGGGEPYHRGLAWIVIAFSQKCSSEFADVAISLRKAREVLLPVGATYGIGWARVIGALALLKEGRYREALVETESAARELSGGEAGVADLVALLRATGSLVSYERGELENCQAGLEAAMPHLHRQGIVDAMISGYVAAARLHAAHGRLPAALDVLAEGQRVGVERSFERLRITLIAERALMLVRHGADREARIAARAAGLLPDLAHTGLQRDKGARLFTRLALAEGKLEHIPGLLAPALARARQTGQRYKIAELLLLDALYHDRLGQTPAAFAALTESLEIGLNEGYLRIYLDEGKTLRKLLRALAKQASLSPPLAPFVQRLLQGEPAAAAAAQHEMIEPLSEREMQVLGLLAEGRPNLEIAQQLFLTEGTVKWHLHNLYGKLNVGTRTAALHAAQRAGLLA